MSQTYFVFGWLFGVSPLAIAVQSKYSAQRSAALTITRSDTMYNKLLLVVRAVLTITNTITSHSEMFHLTIITSIM